MAGKQKKSSNPFSFFNVFKAKSSSSSSKLRKGEDRDDFVKAYKVWPSDEDRGRWVAKPGVDRETSAYISTITERWKNVAVAN